MDEITALAASLPPSGPIPSRTVDQLCMALQALAHSAAVAGDEFIEDGVLDVLARLMQFVVSALEDSDVNVDQHTVRLGDKTSHLVAELAKDETARDPMRQAGLIPLICRLQRALTSSSAVKSLPLDVRSDAVRQTLRAVGNVCVDNDDNRSAVLDSGGLDFLLRGLGSPPPLDEALLPVLTGALLNAVVDYEHVQAAFVEKDGYNIIAWFLKTHVQHVLKADGQPQGSALQTITFGCRVVGNFVETKHQMPIFVSSGCFATFVDLLQTAVQSLKSSPSSNISQIQHKIVVLDALCAVLHDATELNEFVQVGFCSQDLLPSFLSTVEEFDAFLRQNGDRFGKSKENDEDQVDVKDVQDALEKVIVSVFANDENMPLLAQSFPTVSKLKQWLNSDQVRESMLCFSVCLVIWIAGLSLGNVARSDDTCGKLVQAHDVVPPLLACLAVNVSNLVKSTSTEDRRDHDAVKNVRAVSGAVGNLTLSNAGRVAFQGAGILKVIAPLLSLDDDLEILGVKQSAFAITKNMARNSIAADEIVSSDSASSEISVLRRLTSFLAQSVSDSELQLRMEGARAVANVVKNTFERQHTKSLFAEISSSGAIPALISLVTGLPIAQMSQSSPSPALSNAGPSSPAGRSHFPSASTSFRIYPALQNEGIIALTLLCEATKASDARVSSIIVTFESYIVPPLLDLLDNDPASDDRVPQGVRVNACLLLRQLASQVQGSFKDRLSNDTLPILDRIRSTENTESSPNPLEVSGKARPLTLIEAADALRGVIAA
ncbi:hypothetical protein M427DRAFT_31412 [Gonapodya prolifera JEL478]|uniref:ARM repeat-containing protein n=1 Tax=Gonapodya prolifera (strain JEL478) TaxID=1344416 RepID=A0A139AHE6_GONPJ|nr:hypothetical protein M427DRAFT_31412 [Gonapodya prolifera JEL478]|eukprot:KXS16242.1 hypothetical protein M427DRAFT_31412 [Gonapodya prolifera JEL478]